jgi:uncharacterized phage-associated protein
MAYSAKAVANCFLDLAGELRANVDPLKMQKLVYFAHGWHLALRDSELIRESVEAWPHGPVIAVLYHEFKRWGNAPIRKHATAVDSTGRTLVVPTLDAECIWEANADEAKAIIRRVWDVYGKYSGLQLSAMTHQAGTPWAATRAKHPNKRDVDIPDEDIQAFFKARLLNAGAEHPAAR